MQNADSTNDMMAPSKLGRSSSTEDILTIAIKNTLSDIMMYTDFEIVNTVVEVVKELPDEKENEQHDRLEDSKKAAVMTLHEEQSVRRGRGRDGKARNQAKSKQQEVTPPRRSNRVRHITGFYNENNYY